MTRPPRRWLPIVLGALTFLVVLVGLGSAVGDWTARNVEMRTLVTQIEESESAMGDLQEQVQALAAKYQGQAPLDATQQAALDDALKTLAASSRDRIAAAGDDVAGVHWLLWHRDVKAAQEAYLAHNRAWQAYLDRASTDPSEFARQQDLINSTFGQAEIDVTDAVPIPALWDLQSRVDAIFAPAPLPEGVGQDA